MCSTSSKRGVEREKKKKDGGPRGEGRGKQSGSSWAVGRGKRPCDDPSEKKKKKRELCTITDESEPCKTLCWPIGQIKPLPESFFHPLSVRPIPMLTHSPLLPFPPSLHHCPDDKKGVHVPEAVLLWRQSPLMLRNVVQLNGHPSRQSKERGRKSKRELCEGRGDCRCERERFRGRSSLSTKRVWANQLGRHPECET